MYIFAIFNVLLYKSLSQDKLLSFDVKHPKPDNYSWFEVHPTTNKEIKGLMRLVSGMRTKLIFYRRLGKMSCAIYLLLVLKAQEVND